LRHGAALVSGHRHQRRAGGGGGGLLFRPVRDLPQPDPGFHPPGPCWPPTCQSAGWTGPARVGFGVQVRGCGSAPGSRLGSCHLVRSAAAPDPALVLSRRSIVLRSRLPPPEDEVRDWHDPGGADHRHHRRPKPLRASNLTCRPPLEVDERRKLEEAFGDRRDREQPACALAQIAPLSSGGHAILRTRQDPDGVHPTSVWHSRNRTGDPIRPSRRGRFTTPASTPCPHTTAQVRGAACDLERKLIRLVVTVLSVCSSARSWPGTDRATALASGSRSAPSSPA
jgi:hypothetical protein